MKAEFKRRAPPPDCRNTLAFVFVAEPSHGIQLRSAAFVSLSYLQCSSPHIDPFTLTRPPSPSGILAAAAIADTHAKKAASSGWPLSVLINKRPLRGPFSVMHASFGMAGRSGGEKRRAFPQLAGAWCLLLAFSRAPVCSLRQVLMLSERSQNWALSTRSSAQARHITVCPLVSIKVNCK